MSSIRPALRSLVRLADVLAGWLLVAICALNLAAVFQRYVMLDSISWSEEAIRYLAIWMTFFGVAAASWLDEHMDMNLLSGVANPLFQRWHRAILHLMTAVFAFIVLWQGVRYVGLNGMQTAPTTGVAMYFVYSAIPVGGFLVLLVSLVKIYDSLVPPAEPDGPTL